MSLLLDANCDTELGADVVGGPDSLTDFPELVRVPGARHVIFPAP